MPEGEVWRSQGLTCWCFVNATVYWSVFLGTCVLLNLYGTARMYISVLCQEQRISFMCLCCVAGMHSDKLESYRKQKSKHSLLVNSCCIFFFFQRRTSLKLRRKKGRNIEPSFFWSLNTALIAQRRKETRMLSASDQNCQNWSKLIKITPNFHNSNSQISLFARKITRSCRVVC